MLGHILCRLFGHAHGHDVMCRFPVDAYMAVAKVHTRYKRTEHGCRLEMFCLRCGDWAGTGPYLLGIDPAYSFYPVVDG